MRKKLGLAALSFLAFIPLAAAILVAPGNAGAQPLGRAPAQEGGSTAPQPLVLTDGQERYPLGLHLELLEDPGGELTIEEVASAEFAGRFTPSQEEVPNFGFTDSVFWVRFRLDNQTRQTDEWLLEQGFANMQYVDLYTPLPDGQEFAVKQSGNLQPPSSRDRVHPQIVFSLPIAPQDQQTVYLRFQNGASMTLPLTLWTPEAFSIETQVKHVLEGLFLGVLLGLLAYNVFLFLSLRETSYLYLLSCLTSIILFDIAYSGYLEAYIFPSLYVINPIYIPLTFALIFVSTLAFTAVFLQLKQHAPKFHRITLVFLLVWGLLILLVPVITYLNMARLMTIWAVITLLMTLLAGVQAWQQGFLSSRYHVFAWFGLAVGVTITILMRQGLVPSNFFSEGLYRVGFMWMAVSLSLALADRINLLKAETERANRELRSSEFQLTQILEGLPLGVVVYGPDQKPYFTNQRTAEILDFPARGIQADPSAGRTLAQAIDYFSFRIAGSDQAYPLENFPVYQALQGESAGADDIEADRVDQRLPLEIWASPVWDEAGNVQSAVVAFRDITQRKQIEAELVEYRRNLEQLVEKRTAQLSDVNQQLNLEVQQRMKLEKILFRRIAWLSALNEVRQTLNGAADLPQAYQQLSARILELYSSGGVFVLRWSDQDGRSQVLSYARRNGSTLEQAMKEVSFPPDLPLRRELEQGNSVRLSVGELAALPAPFGDCIRDDPSQTLVLAPLVMRQSTIGMLGVAVTEPPEDFSPMEEDPLRKIALDLANLAQDADLLDQARMLAVIDERSRLARDLHDSVTQVLFSATLVAEVLPQIWRRDPERGQQSLERLRKFTHTALAEMRTLLLELRPAALTNTPLGELLAQLTEAVTGRSEVEFTLFIEKIPVLPEEVQTNFYRIAQEALNNVVKHAQAKQVMVSLSAAPLPAGQEGELRQEIQLAIRDDGVGFDFGTKPLQHLGIRIMRERAAAIQAELSLESRPGYGTSVTLTWIYETRDQP